MQLCLGFGAYPRDERSRALHALDQVDGLAGPDDGRLAIALSRGRLLRDTFGFQRAHHLAFAALPSPHQTVSCCASGLLRGRPVVAYELD